jgi:hypothetical protein
MQFTNLLELFRFPVISDSCPLGRDSDAHSPANDRQVRKVAVTIFVPQIRSEKKKALAITSEMPTLLV